VNRNQLQKRLGQTKAAKASDFSMVSLRLRPSKSDTLLFEVPQHLEIIAARLANGENIYSVLTRHSQAQGEFAKALGRLARRLQLGESLESGLATLDQECRSPIVSEFVNKVVLSLRRGSHLADQLVLLAESARGQLRVQQLRAAGRNEVKMLVPLVFLILPVTILFAIFPSLQLLQVGF
jgi:tight adherence protein C